MALSSYAELIVSIGDWLNRTDLTSRIPDFITLAEADIRVDLRSRGVTLDDTILIDGPDITLPADVRTVRSLYDEDGPIRLVAPERIMELRTQYPTGWSRAEWAAIIGSDVTDFDLLTLMVAPVPNENVTATIIYEPYLQALSATSTNWLLTKHPTVYLYGALKHSAPYLRDDERVPLWEKMYNDSMSKLQRLRDEVEFGAGPLVATPRRAIGG